MFRGIMLKNIKRARKASKARYVSGQEVRQQRMKFSMLELMSELWRRKIIQKEKKEIK